MQKPTERIIAEGQWAQELLSSDHYCAMFKEYTDAMLATIVSSAPHEVKAREFEYAKLQAMIGFNNHLTSLVMQAQSLLNPAEALDDE
uniref:Uncharacterized protein n=1 Tax=Rhodopseudomonas palustris (strain DX-1) TaxID=652103 RepID=E6VL39_RHOPX